jgi:hypothetical protein
MQVAKARKEAMEKVRTMTVVKDAGDFQPHAVTKNGLFSEFKYVTSAYSLYNELENKARDESKAKIAAVCAASSLVLYCTKATPGIRLYLLWWW